MFVIKNKFLYGCKSAIPIVSGYIPLGIGCATIALKSGFNPFQTVSFSLLVYGGSSQIIAATMVANGASLIAILLTTFAVNFRYIMMNTVVYNKMTDNSLLINILSVHLVTYESFALFSFEKKSSLWFT